MKYMVSWFERSQGSPTEYENAQNRILEVFRLWKAYATDPWYLLIIDDVPLAIRFYRARR